MAKKDRGLSVDELLEHALVPKSEHPYKVPESWCWVRFGYLAKDIADGPFGSNLKTDHYTHNKEVRIIQLSNIGDEGWKDDNLKYTTFEHAKTISRSIVKPGEIVIAKMMPAGRAIIVPNVENDYILSSDVVKFVPHNILDTRFILYGINCSNFNNQVLSETQGITRSRTSIGKLKTYAFPLPPLEEQKRIVEQIDFLFDKLGKAVELIKDAVDTFELRKASILYQAFSGKLTSEWRYNHKIDDRWGAQTLESMYTFIDYRGKTPNKISEGIPLITAKNIKKGFIDYTIRDYISEEEFQDRKSRGVANKGDILFTTEAPLGNVAIADLDVFSTGQRLIALKNKNKIGINNNFVMYYMLSNEFKNVLNDQKTGSTVAGIKAAKLKKINIPIPKIDEQMEIVKILTNFFIKENDVKEMLNIIEDIDMMKKSILVMAYRGELMTTDYSNQNSIELLKKILAK